LCSDRTKAIVLSLALHGTLFLLPPLASTGSVSSAASKNRLQVDLILDTEKTSVMNRANNSLADGKTTLHNALPSNLTPPDSAPDSLAPRDPELIGPPTDSLAPSPAPVLTGKDSPDLPLTSSSPDTPLTRNLAPREEASTRQETSPKQGAPSVVGRALLKPISSGFKGTGNVTGQTSSPAPSFTSVSSPGPDLLSESASSPTLAAGTGVGTAIAQKTPAIPAEPGIFADTPETDASKPQAFGDTTSVGNATTNKNKTYSNSDDENYSDGLGKLPLQASSSGQEATNHASIANASTDQVSPAQGAAAESATSQAATDHFAQVPPVQSAASEKALLSVSSPPITQAPTKPESRITSAQEILDFLSAQLSIKKTYPDAAKQRHIEGKVRVGMSIAADGALKSVRVIGKSGSTILDRAAVTLVTELFPLSRQLEKAMDVAIIIEYKLVK